MMFQQPDQVTRKVTTRPAIVFNRPNVKASAPPVPQICTKTKAAVCLLCLFDGLRTPSIRRLVRKPRLVCGKPLLTFDPSFYAPSSMNALQELYEGSVNCPCDIAVDPGVQTVFSLLQKHSATAPSNRVLVHYYGHGSLPPSSDGSLYFFTEDRQKYKPMKMANFLNACQFPLVAIFDCPSAGILTSYFASKPDTFVFFSCAAGEQLHLSTDAPLDLFSSCLLSPFETALWWHMRRHGCVLANSGDENKINTDFMEPFLDAVLESIAFDAQNPGDFEQFSKDPSVATLARGFVLSQRIMQSFNIHSSCYPELKGMASHPLWGFWDTAIDCALTMTHKDASKMIFGYFSTTFKAFPTTGVFPLFSFALKHNSFHNEAVDILLNYIDTVEGATKVAARSNLPRTIIDLDKPSYKSLIILSKIIASESFSPFEQQSKLSFSLSQDSEVIKAGMLTLCCAVSVSSVVSFSKLAQLCIEHAVDCAPFSAMLLALVIEKAGRLMNLSSFSPVFLPLLQHKDSSYRATTTLLLGLSRDKSVVESIATMLQDPEALVRSQAIHSLTQLLKSISFSGTIKDFAKLESDPDQFVREAFTTAYPIIKSCEKGEVDAHHVSKQSSSRIVQCLLSSVKSNGFTTRYNSEVFTIDG